MPKKKRRRRPSATTPARRRALVRHDSSAIDALLDEFVICRCSSVTFEQAAAEADHVKALLVLATGVDGDPTEIRWTEERLRHLLLELVPRHQWQPREMLFAQIPALGEFFTILDAHGRWHRENMELGAAQALLGELVLPVLEAVDDPSRPSGPENIHAYAASLGVRTDDERSLAKFIAWFNGHLTREQRLQIASTGRFEGWPPAGP
ncbi:hypothetical protein ACT3SP_14135 [Brachybacterium sp. AOP43-C2-M15]|uniref:hypothetical protein n=1 Tax=Brachybacterium sp. AOP43-C2-M15 TaxID=3457661 RepID=UPI004034BD34